MLNKQQKTLNETASYLSQSTCAGTPVEFQAEISQNIDIFSFKAEICGKNIKYEEEEEVKLPSKQLLRKVHSAAAPTDSSFYIAASKMLIPRPKPLALEIRQTKLTEFFAQSDKKKTLAKIAGGLPKQASKTYTVDKIP